MITAVIFDIGGVLAKDVWEHMYVALANKYGLDQKVADKVGSLLWESYAYITESSGISWHDLEVRYWKQFISFFDMNSLSKAHALSQQY